MEPGAQEAIAKSFIKLHLNPITAAGLARETNVFPDFLKTVAQKHASVQKLESEEADAFGRFDLSISAMVDRAYERADQYYRNSCKAVASIFAIALAFLGNTQLSNPLPVWEVLIVGLIATPLAPIAKDVANAIQKASDAVRAVKG